jgi:phosphate transport system substrate-binding protein
MTVRQGVIGLLAALALVPSFGCAPSDSVTIQGCGATFPAPIYKRWFLELYRLFPNIRTNYQAIGSGAGVRQLEEGLVHFAGTDEALKADRLQSIAKTLGDREHKKVELLQIPLTAGSVALCYNVPGVGPELKLSRKAYVGILLGDITEWNDPEIQKTNPGVELPHLRITFIRRAESSGTTFVFTNHLNAIDKRWTKEQGGPGVGKSVTWPVGIGGKGTAGVAALILQTPGGFGYIESGYAKLTEPPLPMAALENRSGNFVAPSMAASRESLTEAKFDKVFRASVADPKGPNAYPIVTFTWVVCRKHYDGPRVGAALKQVLMSCLETKEPDQGQNLSESLGYVPLPEDALKRARAEVALIDS